MTGLASVRHIPANSRSSILRLIHDIQNQATSESSAKGRPPVMEAGGRFTTAARNGIVCAAMNALRELRRLRFTQDGLARRIGAAGKAVIYQWESRKRTPSPVLWQQVMRLQLVGARAAVSSLEVAPNRELRRAAGGPQAPPDLAGLQFVADQIPEPAGPSLDRVY